MRSKLRIQKLGIEFENPISDEDSIDKLNEILKSNQNYIKTLIIKNIAYGNFSSLRENKCLREICIDLVIFNKNLLDYKIF